MSKPLVSVAKDDALEIHDRECVVDRCPQHYSPDYGYFTLARNDDYWAGTASSSLRIKRDPVQALCGEHRYSMFLVSFDRGSQEGEFRCQHAGCRQALKIVAGGPPAYWLGRGFFNTRMGEDS